MKIFNKMWVIALLLVVFVAGHAVNANELRPNTPTVSSTNPASGATNVTVNRKISATFSSLLDSSIIEKITFTLKQGSASVHGKVAYVGVTAVFTPSKDLEPNAEYTATIETTNKKQSGNKLTVVKSWSFSTGSRLDGTAPTVSFTVPENDGTGVVVNRLITATFSEAMDPSTIKASTFTLKQGKKSVSGKVTYVGVTAIFIPENNLKPNTEYTAAIKTKAKDMAGNKLADNKVWSFTTGECLDTKAPTVSSTDPANGITGVVLNQQVAASFSEAMDPLTITTETFTLMHGTTAVSGAVTYVGVTATFTPESGLVANTAYTATITTKSSDLAGNVLTSDKVWSFTTGNAPDTTAPTVSSTDPANGNTGVVLNQQVAATFSEAMDPLTITTETFILRQGPIDVSGAVTYVGVTATFTPASSLAAHHKYTATIASGAKDLSGNALASDKVWSFTTGAAPDTTAPTVSSTDPANGNTGVVLNQRVAATFSEAMDPLTITTETFTVMQGTTLVSGAVTYTGVTATFTPASSLSASTVYTATIATGAKDLAGNALASDKVWSFTTGIAPDITAPTVSSTNPANGNTGVVLDQRVAATFSEAMDTLTITTATFTLMQGTTPISGAVTYVGVTATFTPSSSLAANTEYTATIAVGAKDLAGNALASAKVWSFTTGNAPDTTAPTVSSTDPANGNTGVVLNQQVAATFSEAMDPLTITTATFTLMQGTTPVSGSVIYAGVTATFTPESSLSPSAEYTATITVGAKDLAGNALASAKVWTFITGLSADTTAPTVSSTDPANGNAGVGLNRQVAATFSEPMDPLTITTATFTLMQGASPVSGAVIYAGVTATFTPASSFEAHTKYTATIAVGAKDLAGNALANAKVWSFTTGAAPDTTAPTVSSTDPANGDTGVVLNQQVAATFSEPMDPLTITTATFTLMQGTTPVSGTVIYSGVTATFTPASSLTEETEYTATIATGAKDIAGNALASAKVWSFTTGVAPDITAPTVSSTNPADNDTGVALNKIVFATFSESMNPLTITNVTFTLTNGVSNITGTVAYVGLVAAFTADSYLMTNTTYTATITTAAKDLAGNALAGNKVWSFTTVTTEAEGPQPVDLGTAGNFVILAKSGISTTGTTAIVGNIGISPAAASFITGFALVADSTNTFSTSSLVTGNVYAADYAPPTPANMTTAISNMETAFTDAAGRTSPDFTELGAGDISGMTLVPGLYKWGTGVLITSGVTLSGGANDVWIFQIAGNLTVSNSAMVTMIGALPKNVFWQVSGKVTLGTAADFKGIILSQTLISLNTGAVMNGRALAQTAVTLDANAITKPD